MRTHRRHILTHMHSDCGGLIHLLGLSPTHTHSVYDAARSIDTWRNAS